MANGIVLNIDTTKSEFQNPMIELRQGDGNYQSLDVTVTSNGSPFNLTGWTITFMGTTAGGFKIVDASVSNVDTANGKFTYTPTKAWGQDEGMFKEAYFKFTSGVNGNSVASGASLRVNVLTAVDLTAAEAGDYISVVDVMIDQVKTDMDTKLAETKQTLADTQSQANTVQTNVSDLNTNVNDLKAQNNAIKTTDNTWTGTNTFNKKIIAPAGIQGNADTATKLQTQRKINGTNFDGTSDINVNAANDTNLVHNTGTETVAGNKTFTGKIIATQLIQGAIDYTLLTGGTDFNTLTSVGKYRGSGAFPNAPVTTNYQYILIVEAQGEFISQVATRFVGGKSFMYFRTLVLSTWSPWTILNNDDTVVHNTGTETINGDKTFRSGNYGLRVTTTGIQKTSDNGVTWTNI